MRPGSQQERTVGTVRQDRFAVRARLAELGLREPLGGPQIGPAEIGAHSGGIVETCAGKVRSFQVGDVQAGVLKAGSTERSLPKGALAQVGPVETRGG